MTDCSRLLELAKTAGISRRELALRLHVTPDHLNRLSGNPRHSRRVKIAVLEALLDKERTAETVEGLICSIR
jgi:hypothetical protein